MRIPPSRRRRTECGVAVVVVLALLAIVTLYVTANLHSLRNLHREVRLVEERQLRFWSAASPTNPPAADSKASSP